MMNEHLWEDLLLAIEERQVVPIVGDQLLTVDTPDGPQLFHHLVAEHLARELEVDTSGLPPDYVPNDVVCAYKDFHGDPQNVSKSVVRIVRTLKLAPPETLKLLAEIDCFQLFLSTSFDTLLEDAIGAVRGEVPPVVAFPPPSNDALDFDEQVLASKGAMVFQLFGRAMVSAQFAVTEGQMLELMHQLMEGPGRPENLIARLQKSHLLVLGVGLPDWLSRFLMRLSRDKPLWDSRTKTEVIVGGPQEKFAAFMKHFSPNGTHFVNADPREFVRELHRRWFVRHPRRDGANASVHIDEKPAAMADGSIFVSYAHEDRVAAFRIADLLSEKGLEVWIDRRLDPGDEYGYIINSYIRRCSAFIPVISRSTQSGKPRWFRREWAEACDVARSYFGSDRRLLFPVVVDDMPFAELEKLEEAIFKRSAVRAPDGLVPAELIQALQAEQKSSRRQARS